MSLTEAKLSSLRDKHLEQEAIEAKAPKAKVVKKESKKLGKAKKSK